MPDVAPSRWTDAEGNAIASPQQEVDALLADRPPAIDFAQLHRGHVTRRLYRDGLTQYFINKTPCRLRDITDFFLGTGVGTKAYAIIEQGRVGQIVSARGRRIAARSSKRPRASRSSRPKKKAAEKKLDSDAAEPACGSPTSSPRSTSGMGTLRRQAQKAERYRKYKAELRDIDLWTAAQRWLELHAEEKLVERLPGARRARARRRARRVDAPRTRTSSPSAASSGGEEAGWSACRSGLRARQPAASSARARSRSSGARPIELDARAAQAAAEIDEIAGAARARRGRARRAQRRARRARGRGRARARRRCCARARRRGARAPRSSARSARSTRRAPSSARGAPRSRRADAQLEALARRRDEATRGSSASSPRPSSTTTRVERARARGQARVVTSSPSCARPGSILGGQPKAFELRRDALADEVARGEAEVETLRTELAPAALAADVAARDPASATRASSAARAPSCSSTRASSRGRRGSAAWSPTSCARRSSSRSRSRPCSATGSAACWSSEPESRRRGDRLPQAGRRRAQRVRPDRSRARAVRAPAVPKRRSEGEGGTASWMSPAWREAHAGSIEVEDRMPD